MNDRKSKEDGIDEDANAASPPSKGIYSASFLAKVTALHHRFHLLLRHRTEQHLATRWLVFVALLAFFMVRTLYFIPDTPDDDWYYYVRYNHDSLSCHYSVVWYALGIHFLAQASLFWNPFNEILGSSSSSVIDSVATTEPRTKDEENSAKEPLLPQRDDGRSPRERRYNEFQLWYSYLLAVLVAIVMTFSSVFDLPVYWPILLAFFLVLVVVLGCWNFRIRRQINAIQEDDNDEALSLPANLDTDIIRIHLAGHSSYWQTSCAIVKMEPWKFARTPPRSFRLEAPVWHSFLRDLDRAMIFKAADVQMLYGILWTLVMLCLILPHVMQTVLDWTAPQGLSLLAIEIIVELFLLGYIVFLCKFFHWYARMRREWMEKVSRVCDDFCLKHPAVSCQIVKGKYKHMVVVQVQPSMIVL